MSAFAKPADDPAGAVKSAADPSALTKAADPKALTNAADPKKLGGGANILDGAVNTIKGFTGGFFGF
ncbi:unnamed protein product [Leptosia nina]|uniref:Uncharacterized protein n=1 Tax=Leptosia nina TaxID=320188 RepID=A0AAV1JRD7_9NEOP